MITKLTLKEIKLLTTAQLKSAAKHQKKSIQHHTAELKKICAQLFRRGAMPINK